MAVVDLSLGDSSGLDLLGEIRSRFPAVKTIVFSIHDAELYASRALRAGAGGFVSKTQPCEDVLVAIRALSQGEIYVAPEVAQRILRRITSGGRVRADGGVELLSDRELQVFELVGRGRPPGRSPGRSTSLRRRSRPIASASRPSSGSRVAPSS